MNITPVETAMVDGQPVALSKRFFEDAQTGRTLRNIRKSLTASLERKYGIDDDEIADKFLKVHGLHKDNFDFVKNIEKVINTCLNDVSIDDNSNKNEKTIAGIIKEITASVDKAVGYDYLYRTAKELYGKDEANRLMGELYDFSLGMNDSSKIMMPYCYAIDASKIVVDGRKFGVLPSAPAKRVASYISALCETIHQMSNHVAGAIAVGTLFLDVAHILVYKQKECLDTLKTDASLRKEIENEFQQFVHSVNHLSRNAAESPFTNISIFDRPKLRGLLNDDNMKWYMPYDEALLKSIFGDGINEENYIESIIEYILELQRIFLGFFNDGDPMNGKRQYRFPVVTVNVSKKYHKDGTAYVEDTSFLKEVCKLEIYRYNIFSSEGSKVASCCRLVNNVELMQYANQSNSFGGSAVSLGSHRVVTVNFNRIANECASYEDYYTILKGRINDAAKILKAHKELILQLERKGLQPFITNGWISMRKMFSTIGILGVNEAVETMRKRFNGSLVGKDLIHDVLKFTNDELNALASTYSLAFNTEQIPGESFAVRLAKADKFIYGDEKIPYNMYANQFVPLWKEATIMERMSEDGKYNKLMTGGAIVHFTLGEKTTSKQNEKLIKYAIGAGCEHFALNAIVSECENHHNTFGKLTVCPVCQKNIVEYYTRVVGFFTPVSSWNETRREWEFPRRVVKSVSDIDHVMSDSALD